MKLSYNDPSSTNLAQKYEFLFWLTLSDSRIKYPAHGRECAFDQKLNKVKKINKSPKICPLSMGAWSKDTSAALGMGFAGVAGKNWCNNQK